MEQLDLNALSGTTGEGEIELRNWIEQSKFSTLSGTTGAGEG
ncbi:hypothetical protein DUNSADRAFT_8786 [Dunaliella salina]|uniref:Uncharacterized protein n=1 Tax=Dunaliella salina TaxID=3046 RepID=A0ABQ7GIU1_DUNSA|nr:hypothetical protein DUNSADRAFT_8786 [Dunaliella salina]|eukprot:KAF5834494.1 hypothetical protein DUNSADRAFT_8786 [Dunaliella salina]